MNRLHTPSDQVGKGVVLEGVGVLILDGSLLVVVNTTAPLYNSANVTGIQKQNPLAKKAFTFEVKQVSVSVIIQQIIVRDFMRLIKFFDACS